MQHQRVDLLVEQQSEIPQVRVAIDYGRAKLFGITPAATTQVLESFANGHVVSQIIDGIRRYDVVVRLGEVDRAPGALGLMRLETPSGSVPLSSFATVANTHGPSQILREDGIRRIAADGTVHTLLSERSPGSFSRLVQDSAGGIYYINITEIDRLAPDGTSTRIAGNGVALAADGLAATNSLILPQGLALDPSGRLVFSDNQTHHVWRIDSAGVLRNVVGTGVSGTAGEGGSATTAQLLLPGDLKYDAAGNLLLMDAGRYLRITPEGILQRLHHEGERVEHRCDHQPGKRKHKAGSARAFPEAPHPALRPEQQQHVEAEHGGRQHER